MKTLSLFLLSLLLITPTMAEETKLAIHMDELSGLLKSLRKIEDTEWNKKADVVRQAQAELLKCFDLVPEFVEKTEDAAEKTLQIAEYRMLLAKNFSMLCQYEIAFLKKDATLVEEIERTLKEIKKDGHNKFIED